MIWQLKFSRVFCRSLFLILQFHPPSLSLVSTQNWEIKIRIFFVFFFLKLKRFFFFFQISFCWRSCLQPTGDNCYYGGLVVMWFADCVNLALFSLMGPVVTWHPHLMLPFFLSCFITPALPLSTSYFLCHCLYTWKLSFPSSQ